MKKSYSVNAWEDKTHPAQFHIEGLEEETARYIYKGLCLDSRWLMVTMRTDIEYTDCQVEESTPAAHYERS